MHAICGQMWTTFFSSFITWKTFDAILNLFFQKVYCSMKNGNRFKRKEDEKTRADVPAVFYPILLFDLTYWIEKNFFVGWKKIGIGIFNNNSGKTISLLDQCTG